MAGVGVVGLASIIMAPRRASFEGVFGGMGDTGRAPGLWGLVLSQGTTWIFARSLMNAVILRYFHGIWGTLPDRATLHGAHGVAIYA